MTDTRRCDVHNLAEARELPIGMTHLPVISTWTTWMLAAGLATETVALRRRHVTRVLHEMRVPWAEITVDDLVAYLGARDWSPNTRRSYRASLVVFFEWARSSGLRADNPAALVPRTKVPRGKPHPTPETIYREALLDADERVRLMLLLAAMCGLRRGEISRLRREDLREDLLGSHLRVKGKGGHMRNVPVPDLLLLQIILGMPPGWLFPSTARPGPLTPAHVGKLVSRSLPPGWTCHTLRHRCATVAYAMTRDLRAVQELLGHASPEETALYTQLPLDAIRRAVAAAAA